MNRARVTRGDASSCLSSTCAHAGDEQVTRHLASPRLCDLRKRGTTREDTMTATGDLSRGRHTAFRRSGVRAVTRPDPAYLAVAGPRAPRHQASPAPSGVDSRTGPHTWPARTARCEPSGAYRPRHLRAPGGGDHADSRPRPGEPMTPVHRRFLVTRRGQRRQLSGIPPWDQGGHREDEMARRTVSVLTATRRAFAAASHLTSMDAGAVETLPGPRRFAVSARPPH